jgi:phage tail-like protein
LEFQTQEYPEGGRNGEMLKFPTRGTQSNIVLKRGIVNRRLWDWYSMLLRGEPKFRRTASIQILDVDGARPTLTLELRNAFPCKWIGPDLNAAQSNIAVESLELCHEGLDWIPA